MTEKTWAKSQRGASLTDLQKLETANRSHVQVLSKERSCEDNKKEDEKKCF